MKNQKIYFCTFADSRLQPTLNRIKKEATNSGFFDNVFIYNEFNLDRVFKKRFKNILKYSVKGYGYWVWKTSVIQDSFSKIDDNDILLYVDSGCNINANGKEKFLNYIDLINQSESGVLGVELQEDMVESKYSKGDLLDYFDVRNNDYVCDSPQIQAGMILLRKNDKTKILINEWQKVFESNLSLITDEDSLSDNSFDFITHRHDQSVFSILFKLANGVKIPLSDVWVKDVDHIDLLKEYPVWYMRNKNKKIEGLKFILINHIKSVLGIKKYNSCKT